MKTVVYIDGFNLYYLALKNTRHKWLNLSTLCEAALPRNCNITAINYYTAQVAIRRNSTSQKDQNTSLKAIATLPKLRIHFGNFQAKKKWMFLVQPVEFRPAHVTPPAPNPEFSRVVKNEEKGSDVNLAAHLVRDAFTPVFEHAVIDTSDTDLKEPIRIVSQEAKLPITLLAPSNSPAFWARRCWRRLSRRVGKVQSTGNGAQSALRKGQSAHRKVQSASDRAQSAWGDQRMFLSAARKSPSKSAARGASFSTAC